MTRYNTANQTKQFACQSLLSFHCRNSTRFYILCILSWFRRSTLSYAQMNADINVFVFFILVGQIECAHWRHVKERLLFVCLKYRHIAALSKRSQNGCFLKKEKQNLRTLSITANCSHVIIKLQAPVIFQHQQRELFWICKSTEFINQSTITKFILWLQGCSLSVFRWGSTYEVVSSKYSEFY